MKNKNRQNFTISEKISEDFKIVCDEKSVNMSKLIENYMTEYINEHKFNNQLSTIINNIDKVKKEALDNNKESGMYEGRYSILKISDYEGEYDNNFSLIARKMITRMVFCSNVIATKFRCGPANACIMNKENFDLISSCIRNEKNGKFIGDIKIIKNDIIGNIVVCMRLSSDYDYNLIKILGEDIDISKQYVGFEVIE